MALSMMSAPTGSSLKVSGIRIAVPAAGPSPGSTPINVPSKQPISAKPKFCRLIAAAKPVTRCWSVSIVRPRQSMIPKSGNQFSEKIMLHQKLQPKRADRERHLEPVIEDVEDTEASRRGREQNGKGRSRAERQQQAGDE